MASFKGASSNSEGPSDADLQLFILSRMEAISRSSVVSVNAFIYDIHAVLPWCLLTDERLAQIVTEAAMLIGLIPVFDRSRLTDDKSEFGGVHGYGYREH